jgi:hypothetical protein
LNLPWNIIEKIVDHMVEGVEQGNREMVFAAIGELDEFEKHSQWSGQVAHTVWNEVAFMIELQRLHEKIAGRTPLVKLCIQLFRQIEDRLERYT